MDGVQHTATATDTPAGGTAFDTGLIPGGGSSEPFTPAVTGTWTYFCEVHPSQMAGATITVTEATGGSSAGDGGSGDGDSSDGDGSAY